MSEAAAVPSTPDAAPARPSPEVQRLRTWSLGLLVALIVLGLAWELWLAPTGSGTLALKVLPLALALPGLWRHRLYTYRWLSLLVWLYVTEGLVRATSEGGLGQGLAALEVLLSVGLFVTAGLYIRRRLAAGRAAAAAEPA